MNRAEKRKNEALAKKKKEWGQKLLPWQKDYIHECVEAAKEFNVTKFVDFVDAAITGALIEKTELSFSEIFEINKLMGMYLAQILKEEADLGTERMFKMKKVEKECLEMVLKLMNEGKKKVEIIKLCRAQFKSAGVTTAEINIAWKRVREKLELEKSAEAVKNAQALMENVEKIKETLGDCDKETEEALEYIFDEPIPTEAKAVPKKVQAEPLQSKFKVTYKEVEVEGKYDTYTVAGGFVNGKTIEDHYKEIEDKKSLLIEQIRVATLKIEELDFGYEEFKEVADEFGCFN